MSNNIKTPWGEIGYITYKRTYARRLKEDDTQSGKEEYHQTIDRVINGAVKQLKVPFTLEEQIRAKEIMLQLKGTVAGRFLWQLGTKTVDKLGLPSLQNCAFTVIDHPITPFTWTFDMLMLGSGVGYNLQREFVYKLPKVIKKKIKIVKKDTNDADFIVPDSREGWVKLLGKVLKAYFYEGGSFTYSTVCIRSKGSPIKGFGGTASGPDDLVNGMSNICKVLDNRKGKQLRPIDCLDIMNIIGSIVVAGNVRRSAQIAIGDYDDIEFLSAKDWSSGAIPNWRAMSNNSVVCNDFNKLLPQFWEGYLGNGEPYGLINLKLAQKCGRIGEVEYPDPDVLGFNPCAEQSLAPYETCVSKCTKIQTKMGIYNIEDLVGKEVEIFNGEEWSKVKPFLTGTDDEFYKVTFNDGSTLKATPNHEFSTSTVTNKKVFNKVKTSDLKVGMYMPKLEMPATEVGASTDWAYTIGAFLGDGFMNNKAPFICADHRVENSLFDACKVRKGNKLWYSKYRKNNMYRAPIEQSPYDVNFWKNMRNSKIGLSDYVMSLSKSSILDLLAGWIDTDGAIRQKGTKAEGYIICGSEFKIKDCQLLCRRAGINFSTIRLCHKKGEVTNFGKRNRDIWTIRIPSFECSEIPTILKPIKNIGKRFRVNPAYSDSKLIDTASRQRIVAIEKLAEKEESYCFSEPKRHMGVFGNVLTYQCCLAEIHLPNIDTLEEMKEVATYLYRINKHSLAIKCHQKDTEEIVHKNMRMGIGVTGYMMATQKQKNWLPKVYRYLREFDVSYSKEHNFPESIKLTTVKPSGTLSLLSGVTPGAHPGYSHFFIRRIRMASDIPLVETCRKNGYPIEYVRNFDGSEDRSTVVVEFPCKFPKHTKVAKDISAIDQLETIKELQSNWSDNAVSVTIYYKKEELKDIKKWMSKNYNDNLKSVSFLLHSDHGFDQSPYEEITKEEYEKRLSVTTPISDVNIEEDSIDGSQLGCAGGICPIK